MSGLATGGVQTGHTNAFDVPPSRADRPTCLADGPMARPGAAGRIGSRTRHLSGPPALPVLRGLPAVVPALAPVVSPIAPPAGGSRVVFPSVRDGVAAVSGSANRKTDCPGLVLRSVHTTGIDHVNLSFPRDRLAEVVEFYVDTLGFDTGFEDPRAAVADDPGLFAIDLGGTYQLFVNPTDDFGPGATNYRHVALRIPTPPADMAAFLEEAGVAVDSTADRESEALGAYTSYYVTDPFGYTVELMAIGE